jgi:hypothetical protein
MADDANIWDWRKNLPPLPTIFPLLGQQLPPSVTPMVEAGIPATPGTSSVTPVLPDVMKNRPPVVTGPGYAPAVTAPGTAGTALSPGLLGFGSPTAVGDPEKTWKERALAALQNKDFMGGLAALAKGAGGKGAPTPHPMQMSGMSMGHGLPDLKGAGGQLMAKALADMAAVDLTKPIQRKSASGAQARYDILGRRQTQDLSELFKNLV